MTRSAIATLSLSILCLGLAGCGGPDIQYDCEQTVTCEESKGNDVGDNAVEGCVTFSEAVFDAAGDGAKDQATELIELCKPKTGCDYTDCLQDEADGRETSGPSNGVPPGGSNGF